MMSLKDLICWFSSNTMKWTSCSPEWNESPAIVWKKHIWNIEQIWNLIKHWGPIMIELQSIIAAYVGFELFCSILFPSSQSSHDYSETIYQKNNKWNINHRKYYFYQLNERREVEKRTHAIYSINVKIGYFILSSEHISGHAKRQK